MATAHTRRSSYDSFRRLMENPRASLIPSIHESAPDTGFLSDSSIPSQPQQSLTHRRPSDAYNSSSDAPDSRTTSRGSRRVSNVGAARKTSVKPSSPGEVLEEEAAAWNIRSNPPPGWGRNPRSRQASAKGGGRRVSGAGNDGAGGMDVPRRMSRRGSELNPLAGDPTTKRGSFAGGSTTVQPRLKPGAPTPTRRGPLPVPRGGLLKQQRLPSVDEKKPRNARLTPAARERNGTLTPDSMDEKSQHPSKTRFKASTKSVAFPPTTTPRRKQKPKTPQQPPPVPRTWQSVRSREASERPSREVSIMRDDLIPPPGKSANPQRTVKAKVDSSRSTKTSLKSRTSKTKKDDANHSNKDGKETKAPTGAEYERTKQLIALLSGTTYEFVGLSDLSRGGTKPNSPEKQREGESAGANRRGSAAASTAAAAARRDVKGPSRMVERRTSIRGTTLMPPGVGAGEGKVGVGGRRGSVGADGPKGGDVKGAAARKRSISGAAGKDRTTTGGRALPPIRNYAISEALEVEGEMEDEDATAADDSAVPPTAATSTKTKQPRRGPQLPTKPGSKTAAANNRTSDILAAAAAVATGTGGVGTFPQQHAQKPSPLGSHAASLAASLTMLADLGVDIKDITIPLPIPGVEGDTGGGQLQTLDLTDMQSLTALFPDVSPEELRQILLLDETSGVASADMMLQLQVDENGVNLPPPDGTDPTGQPGGGGVPTFGLPAQTWGRRAAARTRAAHPHLPHPRHPPPSEYKEQQHYTYTTYADNLAYPNILLPPFRMPPVKQILYGPYEAALWRYLVARQVRVVRLAVERERARSAGMRVEVELEGVGV